MMLKIRVNIKIFYVFFLTLFVFAGLQPDAQELNVINSKKEYRKSVETDSFQKMVEIKTYVPLIVYDLRYATKNNFTGQQLYKQNDKSFVRLAVAKALYEVQQELSASGYGLKIWDAYRPYSITKKMWDLIGDERYVANPSKGSGHNRGLAIDVTLISLKTGIELTMGTGFDNFTDSAHHTFKGLAEEVLKNHELLKTTMEKWGFKALETEWWHYSFPNDRNYEVLDLPAKKLLH
ncbi:MAG: M15 family metallopeptidase [Bacteroidota bacterium]|nr:M15 family metallopeptidase [Bacteroidota bacterium]